MQFYPNTIISKKVIHLMRNKVGKRGMMATKIDLEKAFDHMSWSFIHESLLVVGFPDSLVHMIMTYISSASMRLLWN